VVDATVAPFSTPNCLPTWLAGLAAKQDRWLRHATGDELEAFGLADKLAAAASVEVGGNSAEVAGDA